MCECFIIYFIVTQTILCNIISFVFDNLTKCSSVLVDIDAIRFPNLTQTLISSNVEYGFTNIFSYFIPKLTLFHIISSKKATFYLKSQKHVLFRHPETKTFHLSTESTTHITQVNHPPHFALQIHKIIL